jgi:hypothetical protein
MKNSNQAGKGDRFRPVDKKKYDKNYESIKWNGNVKKIDIKKVSSNN